MWADFFLTDLTPTYQQTVMEKRAMEICGDDLFCVFDIIDAERKKVGMSTMQGNLDLEMIIELSQPGQCVRVCVCVCRRKLVVVHAHVLHVTQCL